MYEFRLYASENAFLLMYCGLSLKEIVTLLTVFCRLTVTRIGGDSLVFWVLVFVFFCFNLCEFQLLFIASVVSTFIIE